MKKTKPTTKIVDCICGNKVTHTSACKRHNIMIRTRERNREYRKIAKERHVCSYHFCGKSIKPEIIYRSFCPEHRSLRSKKYYIRKAIKKHSDER